MTLSYMALSENKIYKATSYKTSDFLIFILHVNWYFHILQCNITIAVVGWEVMMAFFLTLR